MAVPTSFRSTGDPRFYAPSRDCAHYGPYMIRHSLECLSQDPLEPWLVSYLRACEVTLEDVGQAAQVLARAMNLLADGDCPDPATALARAGMDDVPQAAMAVIWIQLGRRQFGGIWMGVRDTLAATDEAPLSIKALVGAGDAISSYLAKPAWRRWFSRAWDRLRQSLASILLKKEVLDAHRRKEDPDRRVGPNPTPPSAAVVAAAVQRHRDGNHGVVQAGRGDGDQRAELRPEEGGQRDVSG